MAIILALICILIAGLINGSYALPTKSIQDWKFENVWLIYSLWAFLILPWISIFSLAPNIWEVYQQIPLKIFWILLAGGLLFGVGQVCFSLALKMIGFGLGFVINIGLGTGLGFLLPLAILHPEKILTPFGYTTLVGCLFIIAGLVVSYRAGKQRDLHIKHTQPNAQPSQYQLGVILAVIAGFCSAIQNFTFASTTELQKIALQHGTNSLAAAMIIWPVFLIFTFIPFALYMLHLHRKNLTFSNYRRSRNGLNTLMSLLMGLGWYVSLVLYSKASLLIGGLGPVVGWPMFMVLIILTSNFWGWRHHEWAHVTTAIKNQALTSIALLVIAVAILAYSATLV